MAGVCESGVIAMQQRPKLTLSGTCVCPLLLSAWPCWGAGGCPQDNVGCPGLTQTWEGLSPHLKAELSPSIKSSP